jgi:hypothetical protein
VFKNTVLRRVFDLKVGWNKVIRRKLHNGEHHNLYSSADIIGQIKSRKVR